MTVRHRLYNTVCLLALVHCCCALTKQVPVKSTADNAVSFTTTNLSLAAMAKSSTMRLDEDISKTTRTDTQPVVLSPASTNMSLDTRVTLIFPTRRPPHFDIRYVDSHRYNCKYHAGADLYAVEVSYGILVEVAVPCQKYHRKTIVVIAGKKDKTRVTAKVVAVCRPPRMRYNASSTHMLITARSKITRKILLPQKEDGLRKRSLGCEVQGSNKLVVDASSESTKGSTEIG